jgi:hypothetical protein
MMAGAALTQLQLAAALAEQIYRRNANDLPIQPGDDLNVQGVAVGNLNGFATSETSDGLTYYYTARGFVGQVVTDGDTLYVVFRGTDAASSFLDGFSEARLQAASTKQRWIHRSNPTLEILSTICSSD